MPARRIEANPFERRSNHLKLVPTPPAPAPTRTRPASGAKKASTATQSRAAATQKPKVASSRSSAATRAHDRAAEARARGAFLTFLAVFAFAIVLGGARVTLLVQASEATIVESRVQAAIKTQSAEVDQLEGDRTALSTPSRLAGIASTTMNMGEPSSVRYISLTQPAGAAQAGGGSMASAGSSDLVGQLFSALAQLSAGEAQSLLVGDLGLAGSR